MAHKIQIKRGNKADLPVLNDGEMGLCIDTQEVFVGSNGTNIPVGVQTEIVNNLTETVVGKALDATQGKILAEQIGTKLAKFVGTTAGTATALTCTITDATLADYTNIQVRLHVDLGASATLNLNGLGAKPIYTSGNVAVGTGALTGSMLNLMYNSSLSRWYLLDVLSVAVTPYTADMVKFFAIPGASGKVRLKVEKPTGSTGAMLRYKTTAWASGDTIATGTLVASVTDDSTYKGANQWYEVSGLTNGTAYYFKAFPYLDSQYNEAIGVNETLCKAGGLYLEYTFDSISGSTVNDTSGNAHNATASNITYQAGLIGNEAKGNGSSGYITTPTAQGLTSGRTITGFYTLANVTTEQVAYVYYGTDQYTQSGILSGNMNIDVINGAVFSNAISANTPLFAAYGHTGLNAFACFNGSAKSTKSGTGFTTGSYAYMFAEYESGVKRYYSGSIDQFRIWGRELETYEIANLYNGGAGC